MKNDGTVRKISYIWFIMLIFLLNVSFSQARVENYCFFSVRDYGAKGDGQTLDTKAIQAAIDSCANTGGGTVFFNSGTYLSGTIFLRDNVTLYLDAGATLHGSTSLDDYPITLCEYRSYTDNYVVRSLIYAEKVKNVAIIGRGTLDGQGAAFKSMRTAEEPYKLRPYMIRMIQCQDVTVRDVTIVNSPMWVQHYLACDDVLIDGITVDSFVADNNDGIDIDSCHKVRIANCNIYSGDDAVVLKATSDRVCKDVTVTNCVLSSHCNAFKLGTESNGGFQNITLSNCTIHDTRLAGIALEMVDGGLLERVNVNNVAMQNCGTALFLRLGNRARPFLAKGPGGSRGTFEITPGMERPGVGAFRKVIITNINAVGIDDIGCSITGIPGHPIEDVTLENIRIQFQGGGTGDLVHQEVPEKEEAYPEYKMFGQLPSYGFFTRHVKDIKFSNVEVEFENPDLRPALIFDDVQDLDIFDVDAQVTENTMAMLWLKNVKGVLIHGCRPTRTAITFLLAENSSEISLVNNMFTNVKEVIAKGKGINKNDIFMKNNR